MKPKKYKTGTTLCLIKAWPWSLPTAGTDKIGCNEGPQVAVAVGDYATILTDEREGEYGPVCLLLHAAAAGMAWWHVDHLANYWEIVSGYRP